MNDECVNNEFYSIKAVGEEEIPAEAFTEAPESTLFVLDVDGAGCTVIDGCSFATGIAGEALGGGSTS